MKNIKEMKSSKWHILEARERLPVIFIPMEEDFTVNTSEGKVNGKAGDYLAIAAGEAVYPVKKKDFSDSYFVTQEHDLKPVEGVESIDLSALIGYYHMILKLMEEDTPDEESKQDDVVDVEAAEVEKEADSGDPPKAC